MTENFEYNTDYYWKTFIRKHVAVFAGFIAAAVLAAIGAIYVFVWFTAEAQTTGLVPTTLGLWTMNNIVLFILHAIFWELVLIGLPVAIAAIVGWLWWKRQPEHEKHPNRKNNHSRDAGGAVSLFMFIAFAIKVYFDGNWYLPISSFTLDYVVGSIVTILIWIAVIFAIPAIIVLIWWLTSGRNKNP
jgi:hypothetical protein